MKISKIDRLVSVVVIGICLVKAVLYGGSKPSYSGTGVSPVHADTVAQLSGTGVSPVHADTVALPLERAKCPFHLSTPSSSQVEDESSAIHHSSFTLLTLWNKRGAYSDWQRIDFPDGFAFPCGTNLLTSVTLMAWGELRCNDGALAVEPHQSVTTGASSLRIVSLPSSVSLEPGVSTCAYGLTPSNSYLFAWQNVCVERDATNRVDAAIELFASGDVQVRFGYSVTNIVARPPEGFVGIGQDTNWVAAAFSPTDFATITNKGYDAWLMEDCVGINESNGKYKVSVTIAELPEHGPCYLVVGPYKMVVAAPGTYSFPLEVFEHYEARTYPTAVPLTFEYDDGYRGEEAQSNLRLQSPPRQLLGVPLILPPVYDIWQEPRLVISPTEIPLETAVGTHISIWCNVAEGARRLYSSLSGMTTIVFTCPTEAEIEESIVEDAVEFILDTGKGTCRGMVHIDDTSNDLWCGCSGGVHYDDCLCDGCLNGTGCRCGFDVTNTTSSAVQP